MLVLKERNKRTALEIALGRRDASLHWLRNYCYDGMLKVLRAYTMTSPMEVAYAAEKQQLYGPDGRPAEYTGADVVGNSSDRDLADGLPWLEPSDIWSYLRRLTAKCSARPPILNFKGRDRARAMAVSNTLMYQWDKAQMQRVFKRLVNAAVIFGWNSVAWSWRDARSMRVFWVRVDSASSDEMDLVHTQYAPGIKQLMGMPVGATDSEMFDQLKRDPKLHGSVMRQLVEALAEHGLSHNGRIRVKKYARDYVGPVMQNVRMEDSFPQPVQPTLEDASWHVIVRERGIDWFERLIGLYGKEGGTLAGKDDEPEDSGEREIGQRKLIGQDNGLERKIQAILDDAGSGPRNDGYFSSQVQEMTKGLPSSDPMSSQASGPDQVWTVTEVHTKGKDGSPAMVEYVVGESHYLGMFESPLSLEQGRIPVNDLTMLDSLSDQLGEALGIRLHSIHRARTMHLNSRQRLVYAVERPYVITSDPKVLSRPETVKRHGGMRMLLVDNPNDLRISMEGAAAQASIVSSLNNDESLMREYMMATGMNNMSANANLDPRAVATATGARIQAADRDELSNEFIASVDLSVARIGDTMRQINMSELTDAIELDADPYMARMAKQKGQGYEVKEDGAWITVEPEMFRDEGTLQVVAGSTAPDTSDADRQDALMLLTAAEKNPEIRKVRAIENLLTAAGKQDEIAQWMSPPPPAPLPPPVQVPEPPRVNLSLSMSGEKLDAALQAHIVEKVVNWREEAESIRASQRAEIESMSRQGDGGMGGEGMEMDGAGPDGGQDSLPGMPGMPGMQMNRYDVTNSIPLDEIEGELGMAQDGLVDQ